MSKSPAGPLDWVSEHVDASTPEGRVALAYVAAADQLTAINSELTGLCARCHHGPIGCCDHDMRYMLGMPPELLRLQEIEAGRQGWKKPDNRVGRCQFHGERGCVIRLSRPTICLAFFCTTLVEQLCDSYGAADVMPFIEASKAFYEGPSLHAIPDELFDNLNAAIAAGRALLAHRDTLPAPARSPEAASEHGLVQLRRRSRDAGSAR